VRSDSGRDLDRHIVDILPGQQGVGAGEAAGGFALSQHRFAEEVHVELRAVSPERPDRDAELRRRSIHDEMSDHAAQDPTGDRHDDTRQ